MSIAKLLTFLFESTIITSFSFFEFCKETLRGSVRTFRFNNGDNKLLLLLLLLLGC